MKDFTIIAMEPGTFGVQVTEAQGVETSHVVHVPEGFAAELGMPDAVPEVLVRETFAFLIDREPSTSIQREFSLWEIDRAFPDYRDEITARVTASSQPG